MFHQPFFLESPLAILIRPCIFTKYSCLQHVLKCLLQGVLPGKLVLKSGKIDLDWYTEEVLQMAYILMSLKCWGAQDVHLLWGMKPLTALKQGINKVQQLTVYLKPEMWTSSFTHGTVQRENWANQGNGTESCKSRSAADAVFLAEYLVSRLNLDHLVWIQTPSSLPNWCVWMDVIKRNHQTTKWTDTGTWVLCEEGMHEQG